jgi:hypothetical protein
MNKKVTIKITVLFILLCCVFLVSFADIDFKELQNEAWFIQIGYMIGFVLVLPAIGVCQIIPDKMLSVGYASSLCIFVIGLLMSLLVVFFSKVLAWLELRDVNNAN